MSKVNLLTDFSLFIHLTCIIISHHASSASWPLSFMPLAFQSHPTASIWPFAPQPPLHHHHHHHRTPLNAPFLRPIPLPEVQLAFPLAHPSNQFARTHHMPETDESHPYYNRLRNRGNQAKIRKQKLAIEKLTQAAVEKLEEANKIDEDERKTSSRNEARDNHNIKHNPAELLAPLGSTPSELALNKSDDTAGDPYRSQASQVQTTARRYNTLFNSDLDSSSIDGKEFLSDPRYIETMPPDPPKKPLDIKRKTIPMPNGQVTYITEMLYDIEDADNGPLKATRPPSVAQFLPPSSDDIYPPTENPAHINTHSLSSIPPSSTVLSFTMPPVTSVPSTSAHFTDRRSTESLASLPTPPTPYRMTTARATYRSPTPQLSLRRESSTTSTITSRSYRTESPSSRHVDEQAHSSRHFNVTRPFSGNGGNRRVRMRSDASNKTWPAESDGLGAAAIAGIVIGSLVSITLLAGTALFVMYRSPFGSSPPSAIPTRAHANVQPIHPTYNDTTAHHVDRKVHRWPARKTYHHDFACSP